MLPLIIDRNCTMVSIWNLKKGKVPEFLDMTIHYPIIISLQFVRIRKNVYLENPEN